MSAASWTETCGGLDQTSMTVWHQAGRMIRLLEGDITQVEAEAIVNAANTSLLLGGGVAGAIRRAGGESIQEECLKLAPIEVGQAVLTGAGRLKARSIIHAVGPVWGEGDEDEKLRRATINRLRLAEAHRLRSVAFPAISAGIFGFPLERCSRIMLTAAIDFLKNHDTPQEVIFCLFGREAWQTFDRTLGQLSAAASS
jgi:O-acetyl-ADP-ribose deacetylase (regulator of RNase III)